MPDGAPAPAHAPGGGAARSGFWGLVVAQFLGAFNDNAFRSVLMYLVADAFGAREGPAFVAASTFLFTLPFVLFSMHAGTLSDRFSKRSVLIASKAGEVVVMASGAAVLAASRGGAGSLVLLAVLLFLMGTQSAYYGPGKYGILPEILPPERLSRGNGIVEATTFLAIILGFGAGGQLYDRWGLAPAGPGMPATHHLGYAGACFTAIALAGVAASFFVRKVAPADPSIRARVNPWTLLREHGPVILRHRTLKLTVAGIVYFWALGAVMLTNIVSYGKFSMGLTSDTAVSGLSVALSGGIAAGSLLAGILSGKTIELGLVPLGAMGMAAGALALFWTPESYPATVAALGGLGIAAGLYSVPLYALLQKECPPERKGSVMAVTNLLTALGMLGASAILWVLVRDPIAMTPAVVCLLAGLATIGATVFLLRLLPEALARLLVFGVTRTFYRLQVRGRENLPDRGPVLLVCNHVSLADGFLLTASTHRLIRFLIYRGFVEHPWVRPLARLAKMIPIAADEGPRALLHAIRQAEEALKQGEVVCIFAEGQITRTGQLLPFQRGFERILKRSGAPVVPVHLDRVWGSVFSFRGGRFFGKWPRRVPYPVTVSFGAPHRDRPTAAAVRAAILELSCEAFAARRSSAQPLPRQIVRAARRLRSREAAADATGARVTYGELLARATGLARALREHADTPAWRPRECAGILLPPSVAGAVANVAALLAGKVVVNLNPTASAANLEAAARACGLEAILTSRAFLERLPVSLPASPIFLEDLASSLRRRERLLAATLARAAPARLLERACGATRRIAIDDVCTVIFSSGSTGDPKGIELTHWNLHANLEGLRQLFEWDRDDSFLGVLPFFHAFGFLATFCLPLTSGIRVVYHVNPLDAPRIGRLVREHRCTFLLATPSFLQTYLRRIPPADFASLRHVAAGAEKLPPRLAEAFRKRFGVPVLEGYGATECAPLVSINVPDYRAEGFHQIGTKPGTVGHPIPGVALRVVDPESGAPKAEGEEGLLLVRGPNVMRGYRGRPRETAAVMREGWYVTGDIARVDEDGFLTITDRLSRFSKIGGEMVPHGRVEEALHRALGLTEQRLAVTAVPDPARGERLVVVHTLDPAAFAGIGQRLREQGLPNLWIPREDAFRHVEELPRLGTGKLDLRRLRAIAGGRAAPPPRSPGSPGAHGSL